jgi:hypothetical protein
VSDDALTGDRRCWPCTVLNAVVGLLVGWVPVAAAAVRNDPVLLAGALVWGVAVTLATVYRLFEVGYLPYAESVAKRSGLHGRIGPASTSDDEDPE